MQLDTIWWQVFVGTTQWVVPLLMGWQIVRSLAFKIVIAMGALCSPSPTGNFFSKVFLVKFVLTLLVTVGKDCTAVLFLNRGENFIVIYLSTEVDSFLCFRMPQCVVKIVTSSLWSASVASKLFRPTAVDACRQVMKTLQFHNYFASSSLPNNTDYKAVETSWILCLSTWFQIIGHKKMQLCKTLFCRFFWAAVGAMIGEI